MPSHATRHPDDRRAGDEAIVEALMVPFSVVVGDVLRHRAPEMLLPDRNQPVEAFFFDRPHKALGVGVRIRCALGREHHADTLSSANIRDGRSNGPHAACRWR